MPPVSGSTIRRRGFCAGALVAALVPDLGFAAAEKHILIGTYGGAGCTGVPEVKAFEKWLGRPVDIVLDFLQMDTWDGMVKEAGWITGCWHQLPGRRLAVSVPMLVQQGKPTLADGAGGAFDDHFQSLAQTLVQSGYPESIVRIGWEFNGGWYPWTARGDAATFAKYWRRIAKAMRAVPGNRFRFDWCPTTVDGPTESAYPGDDVVDIIGLDIYNQSWPIIRDPARRWEHLVNMPSGLQWHRQFAAKHNKPRSFPEWGTGTRPDGHGGGDDPLFIKNMAAWMLQGGPVEYACYWNYRASDYDAKVTDGKLPKAEQELHRVLQTL